MDLLFIELDWITLTYLFSSLDSEVDKMLTLL